MSSQPLAESANLKRIALNYDAHASVQRDAATWLAEWLPPPNSGRCLELGAGTGLFTTHLQGRFGHIEVSDSSSDMLEVCCRRVQGIHQRTRDAWQPQHDPASWDYLASSSLLQWIPHPGCIRHWQQILKPHGHLLAGFFIKPSLPEMAELLESHNPIHWFDENEWTQHFLDAGLQVNRIETDTRRYDYESPLHFWKSLHGTGAAVSRRLAPSQMIRLFKDYESRFASPENGVFATWTFCRVELINQPN